MPYNYTAVTAACLCIKKSKFNEVNGFDEKLKVAIKRIDKAMASGLIHKNKAAREKSKLTKKKNEME